MLFDKLETQEVLEDLKKKVDEYDLRKKDINEFFEVDDEKKDSKNLIPVSDSTNIIINDSFDIGDFSNTYTLTFMPTGVSYDGVLSSDGFSVSMSNEVASLGAHDLDRRMSRNDSELLNTDKKESEN
jgi:hypothetical protein